MDAWTVPPNTAVAPPPGGGEVSRSGSGAAPGRDRHEPIPAPQLRVWRAFLDAHAAVSRRLEEDLQARHRLPLSHYDVLVQLQEAEDEASAGGEQVGLRVQELAERVVLTRSGVSRLVDRMQAQGLVTREPCPTDRRGTVVVLTPAGRQALAAAGPDHHEGIREHFTRHLTAEETAVMDRALSRILTAARGGRGSPDQDQGPTPARRSTVMRPT